MQALTTHPLSTASRTNPSSWNHKNAIDELILSGPPWQASRFLKSMLNDLANDQEPRWLTLILSSEHALKTKKWLKLSGISNNRVQVLNPSARQDSLKLTRQALASGTSHTVVSWLNQLDSSALNELELAARSGRCQGLAIRNRN